VTCPHGNTLGACSWCDLRDDGGLPEAASFYDAEWREVVEKMLDSVWERLNPKGDPDAEDWKDWDEPVEVFAAIERALSEGVRSSRKSRKSSSRRT
jgi:hypothetical protein